MEESIFENICKHSKQNLTELQHKSISKKRYIIYGICFLYLLIIFAESIVYMDFSIAAVLLVLVAVLVFLIIFLPKRAINLTLKRQKELCGTEEPETEIKFFEDRIFGVNKQSKSETTTPYDHIKKVCETKNLYLLYLPGKLAILVDKNGFTKGNKEDFIAFLMSKAPKAKFKVKG